MIITRIEPEETAQVPGTDQGEAISPGRTKAERPGLFLMWEFACIICLWVFVLVVTHEETFTWLYSPDSEFYATLSAFGREITDRAPSDAYFWTKLGIIAPQYLLSQAFGFMAAHEIFRAGLLLLVMASGYVVARVRVSRLIASLAALLLGLNSVILGFLGDTYATGAALAALSLLFTLCYLWPLVAGWRRTALSVGIGVDAGWLIMLHPYFVFIGAISAVVFMLGNLTIRIKLPMVSIMRQVVAVGAGCFVSLLAFRLAGNQIFPGLRWLETLVFYMRWVNLSDYASKNWNWLLGEGSLLVPLVCLAICLGVWRLTRRAEVGLYSAVCAITITALVLLAAISKGPALEVSFVNAILWPASLLALIAALTTIPAAGRSSGLLPLIPAFIAAASWIWLGHWNKELPMSILLAVAAATILFVLALVRTTLHLANPHSAGAVGLLVLALAVAGSGAQLLQNGRELKPVDALERQPYWYSYIKSRAEETLKLDLEIQSWVLENTAPTERVAVWTQPNSYLHGQAAMSLWGPNSVSSTYDFGEWERANWTNLDADAVVLYGNDMPGIQRMASALRTVATMTSMSCKDFTEVLPYPLIGASGEGRLIVCIARVTENSQ